MRAGAGLPFHGEFPAALFCGQHSGFLAPLACEPQHVVARLSLHPPGRKPEWRAADLPESSADDAAGRLVARRQLDFVHLGRACGAGLAVALEVYEGKAVASGGAPTMAQL